MKTRWYEAKIVIYAFVIVLLAFVATNAVAYKIESDSRPNLKENHKRIDISYLYKFYVYPNPLVAGDGYYGNENASLTIISFMDTKSDSSKNFFENIFPRIDEEYIKSGKVKFYPKNYITLQDIEDQNDDFKSSLALTCVKIIKSDKYYDVYFDVLSSYDADMEDLLRKHSISFGRYMSCLEDESTINLLYGDALEIENLGIVGLNQRFYIGIGGRDNTVLDGVPRYAKFQKAIRLHEIQVGN